MIRGIAFLLVGGAVVLSAGVPLLAQQTATTLTTFDSSEGNTPATDLLLVGDTLYGTTTRGGASNSGTIFSEPISGGPATTLASFDGTGGSGNPSSGLTLYGSTLYGTGAGGAVYSVSITGGTPTILASTSPNFNSWSNVLRVGDTLYVSGKTSVFSVPATGGTLTTLGTISGAFEQIQSGLVAVGDTLYGTMATSRGPSASVFSVPLTGGTPTILASLNVNAFPGNPPLISTLIAVGNTLYGTTIAGGAYGRGDVFSVPTTGGTPTILASFDGVQSQYPASDLTVIGNTLCGTTLDGAMGSGTIFSVPIDGGPITTIGEFPGQAYSYAGVVADGNGNLYGATYYNGPNNLGGVYELAVPEPGSLGVLGMGGLVFLRRRRC